MNALTATVVAKADAMASLNPRLWGALLIAGGVLLIASGLQDPDGKQVLS